MNRPFARIATVLSFCLLSWALVSGCVMEDAPIEASTDSTAQESVSAYFCGGSCGDGYCDTFESHSSCPDDCYTGGFCGDGYCQPFYENEGCCSIDCTPWGVISASPENVYLASGETGSTTIEWNAYNVSTAQVYVKQGSNAEQLFAQGKSGSQTATWIKPGKTYKFKLYAGTSHSDLFDTIEVQGIETVCGNGVCEPGESSCKVDCGFIDPCPPGTICP